MKKILLIAVLVLFSSCLGTKKVTEKEKTTTVKKDSSSVSVSNTSTNRNAEIKDVIRVEVPITDPEIDAKIDKILAGLNTSKKSGTNNYTLSYDRIKREIIAELNIGETKDSVSDTSNSTNVKNESDTTETSSFKKTITTIPWWGWLVIAFLLRRDIISVLSLLMPGLKTVKLFQPPKT